MADSINIYCDESCHLENDGIDVMVLGALSCPTDQARGIAADLRGIKNEHGLPAGLELKWTKVSGAKVDLYLHLVDYFFSQPDLSFRGLVASPKSQLIHSAFGQDHDTWYYKMYFELLKVLLDDPVLTYRIYLDVKDTRSARKERKLRDVLCTNMRDYQGERVQLQTVASHEVEQVQLADLLIGALGYANRGLSSSAAKLAVISKIESRTRRSLLRSTTLSQQKFNVFQWHPQGI